MKKSLLSLAIIATASLAVSVQADHLRGFYAGGGVNLINTGAETDTGGNITISAIEGIGGYKYNAWVGGELRVGTGLSTASTETTEVSILHYESIYYRLETMNDVAKLYGLLGFTSLTLDAETLSTGASESITHSGASFGFGVGFRTSEKGNINVEFKTIIKNADVDQESIAINYDYRF